MRVGGSDNEERTNEVEEHDREMLKRIPFIDTHTDHTTHIARRSVLKKVPFVIMEFLNCLRMNVKTRWNSNSKIAFGRM